MTRASTGRFALALVALALAACTSRTIPLPPPTIPPDGVSAPDVNGLVTVTGTALEGASVGIFNEATMAGVIATSPETGCRECPFQAQIQAEAGDHLRVWQFRDTSSFTDLQVPMN